MREAEEARVKAMELGQTSAAIQAIVAKGKREVFGLSDLSAPTSKVIWTRYRMPSSLP
jgi:hypothetical protein